jgi:hypothetical protein
MLLMLVYLKKNTLRKNTEALLEASREGGIEVNTEKTIWLCLVTKMLGRITIH